MAQHKQRKETAATQAAARKRVAEAKKQAEAASREKKLRRAQERAAQARERAAARKRVYVVQPGDSLSKIAKEVYNDASRKGGRAEPDALFYVRPHVTAESIERSFRSLIVTPLGRTRPANSPRESAAPARQAGCATARMTRCCPAAVPPCPRRS